MKLQRKIQIRKSHHIKSHHRQIITAINETLKGEKERKSINEMKVRLKTWETRIKHNKDGKKLERKIG